MLKRERVVRALWRNKLGGESYWLLRAGIVSGGAVNGTASGGFGAGAVPAGEVVAGAECVVGVRDSVEGGFEAGSSGANTIDALDVAGWLDSDDDAAF
jgi:hypothetical protein